MRGTIFRVVTATAAAALLGAAISALSTAAFAGAAPGRSLGGAGAAKQGPPRVDRDRDKLFDDLELKLAQGSPDERITVIVSLDAPASADRVRALGRAVGGFDVRRRYTIIDGFSAALPKGRVRALARLGVVRQVELNAEVHALNDAPQDSFGVSKARLDAPALDGNADGNVATYSRDDLVAAVIDTGIDRAHEDLNEGKVIAFRDFVNGNPAAYDDEGHGTHVSATIAGEGDARPDRLHRGVAPAAALVGIKVLDSNGNGSTEDVVAGINFAVANRSLYGIEAINLSLGTAGCGDGTAADSLAVNAAHAAGLVVAVAAGNEGPGTCTIGSPGDATNALTVGAMADMGASGFYQAYFSSRGKTFDGRIKPDISAPGVDVLSADAGTGTGYFPNSGTSMATPFTAGVALLMLDANGSLAPQQVKDRIAQTAIDWGRGGDNRTAGSTGADIDYGAGRLDAYAALKSAGAAIDDPPTVPGHQLRDGSLSGTGDQDDYPILVTDTRFPIAATLIHPSISGGSASNPDFDLFLYDPNGNLVDDSQFTTRQEEVAHQPSSTGTYTLRVRSFRGSAGYFVDVSSGASTYPRPNGAARARVTLVPAFARCAAPNSTHGGPLDKSSCSPPVPSSAHLRVPADDSSRASGSVVLRVICTNGEVPPCPAAGDQEDVTLVVNAADVRRRSDGADYSGQLQARLALRITDRFNGPSRSEPATLADATLAFAVPCAANGDATLGSSCAVNTSADAVMPGLVRENERGIWGLGQVAVNDGGPDGIASTESGNTPFLRQALFVP